MVKFTQEMFDEICDMIAEGKSLRSICADPDMPSYVTVFKWVKESEDLANQYARAREAQADFFADDIIHIADTDEDPQKARLRVDARKWAAGQMHPTKYGKRQTLEHSGPNGGPIQTEDTGSASKKVLEHLAAISERLSNR